MELAISQNLYLQSVETLQNVGLGTPHNEFRQICLGSVLFELPSYSCGLGFELIAKSSLQNRILGSNALSHYFFWNLKQSQ